ncbi:hypothetical protein P4O66_009907 [Electrophorus voltai]|uniref:Histone-lysine N-methyltransferase 2C n=1 Tax=Electrophorus voltai TaxID=2609070 RepID=A0AAD9DW54_9TELE|nr:hypothetical protein P4O66_009907 [Electrophorus voltai]
MAKVGRGSGFPGRRRPRGANMSGRGGRGRSRLKTDNSLLLTPGVSSFVETPYVVREEEENTMHNTVVLFSSSDTFTLKQDMCVVCGSFGQGTEGRLLPCSQCGQCYHPFCVNIKITKVVLSKGWRCLECTVCEACGQASDPGRLLLCDDCDISYHTYCLDPPLQNVPKGSWKCKWCVSCIQCGTTSPGLRCDWQNNYTQCGPCASLAVCPICARSYREEELILQCRQCDRWLHASCQGLNSEEEAENAADDGFDCTMCRMITLPTHGPAGVGVNLCDPSSDPTIMAQIVSKIKEHDFQKTYTQDGVCLTESGLCQLQSLSVPSVRRRRHKPKLKLKIINQNSVAVLQTPSEPQCELSREGDMDDSRGMLCGEDGERQREREREEEGRERKGEQREGEEKEEEERRRRKERGGGERGREKEEEKVGEEEREGGGESRRGGERGGGESRRGGERGGGGREGGGESRRGGERGEEGGREKGRRRERGGGRGGEEREEEGEEERGKGRKRGKEGERRREGRRERRREEGRKRAQEREGEDERGKGRRESRSEGEGAEERGEREGKGRRREGRRGGEREGEEERRKEERERRREREEERGGEGRGGRGWGERKGGQREGKERGRAEKGEERGEERGRERRGRRGEGEKGRAGRRRGKEEGEERGKERRRERREGGREREGREKEGRERRRRTREEEVKEREGGGRGEREGEEEGEEREGEEREGGEKKRGREREGREKEGEGGGRGEREGGGEREGEGGRERKGGQGEGGERKKEEDERGGGERKRRRRERRGGGRGEREGEKGRAEKEGRERRRRTREGEVKEREGGGRGEGGRGEGRRREEERGREGGRGGKEERRREGEKGRGEKEEGGGGEEEGKERGGERRRGGGGEKGKAERRRRGEKEGEEEERGRGGGEGERMWEVDLMDCDGKSDSSPDREPNDEDLKGAEGVDSIKKRKRKPYRPASINSSCFTSPYTVVVFFSVHCEDADRLRNPLSSQSPASADDPLAELVLQSDDDLLGMLSDDLVKPGHDSAGLDIGAVPVGPARPLHPAPARGPRQLQEEPLDVILSPELDKMVTDELEGKEVEDLFTAVLSPSSSQSPGLTQPPSSAPSMPVIAMPHQGPGDGGMFPRMPVVNGVMAPNPVFPPNPMMPGSAVSGTFSPIHRMPFPESMREKKFSQMGSDMVGPWSAPVPMPGPAPSADAETDTMSNAQRSTLKWEKEETLGELATVAPVLYTNVNFPSLREEFPDWSTRVKQIAKLWRKASSQERAPYVQKARDNRAALRINKVQLSNDTMKRQQHQQAPDPFDPGVSMETELLFKDPPKQKESQHEQEWKLRQQMRQKSKQQAKIEATQKLEQVKNEQQQLQQQQQKQAPPPPKQHQQHHQQQYSGQSGGDATNSGSGSPMTPQPTNGSNTSPLQQTALKDNFVKPQLPGTPTSSSSSDDVFLRPQPPPQSSVAKTPTHDGQYPQGSSSQSQSPQVFSPGSSGSRPSSPWDPYAKMVGTPRPPPSGSSTPRRGSLSDMQERGRPSPAHEPFGSPTSASADMYTKPPDTPRPSDPFVKPLGPPRSGPVSEQQQPGRYMLASAPTGDNFTRPNHRSEHYQRMPHNRMVLSDPYTRPLLTPIPGSSESGFVPVFKTPMPPSQTQQDPFSTAQQGMRRGPPDGFPQGQQSDPYAHQPHTPHPSMGDAFNSEGRMMRQASGGHFAQPMPINRHPQRDLYAHAPSTPRPDYSQQIADSYAQPPGTPRPHDPYAQPPGTPSPHSDPYSMPPSTPRPAPMEQFSQSQPSGRRQSPSHTIDPYAQMAGTPRPAPGERYPKSPGSQRNADAYMQAAGTPRPSKSDPYDQPPGTPRPVHTDPYSQPPGTPRPSPMVHPSDQFSHQAQNRMPDPFSHPAGPGCQTPKHPGISDEGFSLPQSNPNQTPIHDPFEQAPVTPCPQSGERLAHGVGPQATSSSSDTLQPALGDTEEKLKQRQRLRQLILKQQQQKSAIRQEKGLQEATGTPAPGTPMHWSQEDSGPQNDMFGRPPPPYPGTMRPSPMQGSQRFPGTFLGDQRAPFPDEAQCPRPQFSRELSTVGIRPQGPRFGFPAGATGQEPFLRPPHQMQGGPMVDNVPPQLRRSLPADLPRSMGSSPQMGLPQHFPPRGLTVQQHNIMGQPFIELRHRAPENRVRLPFGPPNILDHPNHPQRPSSSFMTGQNMAFAGNQTPRSMNPMMGQPQQGSAGQMPVSASMENLHQRANMPVSTVQRHPSVTTTHTHPVRGEALNSVQSTLLPVTVPGTEVVPLPCGDGMEEKLDTDDSAVKDLEDVEVKDLVDDDLENLNLDPVDGKDLDLETNDLHLDDFIESGKFDLIAYTDPELNLEDKKDMFNEELDLSDPIEDDHGETSDLQKGLSGKKSGTCGSTSTQTMNKLDGQPSGHIKQEECLSKESSNNLLTESTIKTEAKPGSLVSQDPSVCGGPLSNNRPLSSKGSQGNVSNLFEGLVQQAGVSSTAVPSGSAPVLSSLLTKDKLEDSGIDAHHQGDLPQPDHGPDLQSNMGMVILQGQGQDHSMNPAVAMGHRINAPLAHAGSLGNPNMMTASNQQIPVQGFGASPGHQVDPSLTMVAGQQAVPHTLHPQVQQGMIPPGALGQQGAKVQQSQSNRPLLLDEQPLLLQDLLDQERQEQQQQRQMQAMIRQRSGDQFFPNIDFDAITDPIMKAKMVALKGINRVMAQNSMGMTPIVMNRMQQVPVPHGPDAVGFPQHAFGQDGKLIPQLARPDPPSFGPGFVNDAQRKQYEEWLQETQQLLQMQQKFLEDQIGAHRKSKKALSAKQRTAKKAGREFPEEDAEQLKQVTEQQSVVQKQLEQIRKQQKEHAELIEEYRVKQQQQQQQQQQRGLQPPMMNPLQAMPGMQGQAPAMMSGGPHMGQPMMSPMQPHPAPPNPSRMPNMPGWHPSGPGPMGGPRLPSHMPTQMPPSNPGQLPQAQPPPAMVPGVPPGQHGGVPGGHGVGGGGGAAPHVKFDDNNPFSEGFQERERRERLREQQERQRVQLMQEVERQRALQRLELEQQGTGVGPDSSRDNLSHMPFYSAELPRDFMQPAGPQQPQQMVSVFPQQGASSLDFGGPGPTFAQGGDRRPIPGSGAFPGQEMGPNFRPKNPIMHAINFVPGQPRPSALPQGGSEAPLFGMESATPLPPNYPGSGQSLIQLYSNIIPEEKGKKKRTRKKKDADTESVKTPSTPHSDLTAPLTPCVSDTSSTPTRSANQQGDQDHDPNNPSSSTGLAPSSELEWQLSGSGCPFGRQSGAGSETERGTLDKAHEIKQETLEVNECWGHEGEPGAVHGADVTGKVKLEEGGEGTSPPGVTGLSPAHAAKGDSGNELLKHLLKNKSTSPPSTAPLIHQVSNDNLRSEEGMPDIKGSVKLVSAVCLGAVNSQLTRKVGPPEPSLPEPGKKKQRSKRTPKTGADKPASRWKKRKREREEMEAAYPTTDTLMTQLEQHLTLLPLMEPLIGVNFTHFPPYGSGQLDGENRLSGSFGSASLDGVCDYYSQLIFKQNNLSNPPTPPASLPPTPPPVARPQMVNGFATADELARKADVMSDHAVSKSLGPRPLSAAFRGEDNLLTQAISQGPKTVDVPASLPTPPHTNQEELRGQEHCADRDTPDSFVPSSSPESVVGMEIGRYPDLSLVKEEPLSPAIPILPNASGKGTEIKQWEVKKEPPSAFFSSERHVSYSKSGLMSIALTLNSAAAENIQGVLTAVTGLLHVPVPPHYEVTRSPGLQTHDSLALLAGLKVPASHRLDPCQASLFPQSGMRFPRTPVPSGNPGMMRPPQHVGLGAHPSTGSTVVRPDYRMDGSSYGQKPQWCAPCKVVILGNGVRKSAKDLLCSKQEGQTQAVNNTVFCSQNCFALYLSPTQPKPADGKNVSALPDSAEKSHAKVLHSYSNNMSALDVHSLAQMQPEQTPPSTPPVFFPSISLDVPKAEVKPEALKVTVKLKPRPRAVHNGGDETCHLAGKRWKGLRWRKWSVQIVLPKGDVHLQNKEELEELMKKLDASLRPEPLPKDLRRCCFCHEEGDGLTDGPARLLNLDLDLWVHLNCALWSTEVYETQAGALINVELALRRGLAVRCSYCQQMGATSGCHRLRCTNAYHFTCALRAQCTFFKDKTMLCHLHKPRGGGAAVGAVPGGAEHELRCFAVFRRVYVQRDEARQIASIVQRGEREHTFRVGSLVFRAVGQLLPQQMQEFHSPAAIFPIGYEASRIYWSMRHADRRCRYLCSVDEKDGAPEFSIRVVEQGYEDLVLTGASPKGVWDKVLEPVAEKRGESDTLKLFPVYLKGEDLFGLTVPAVTRIVESLPGVEACSRYTFRYGRNPLMELPLAINPSGCARSEPRACTHVKRPHTLTSSSSSTKALQSNGSPAELTGAPYSKQFVHSKSSQYRRMKAEWKSNVYLARSRIQGLGLYAARDIEKYTMVIEYIGTIIRNEVANRKEKMYEAQNRGVYMFRIDSEHVIDATITGGPARYINHSCAPNCIAEVVTFERGHKIIISSNRRIQRGEELCYDYKFDLEDDQHKIPCHCGAVNCRKWMN